MTISLSPESEERIAELMVRKLLERLPEQEKAITLPPQQEQPIKGYKALRERYPVSTSTIRGWVQAGLPYREVGNVFWFYPSEVDAFLRRKNESV